jgi:YesN/AraC family two-component response regulator
MSKLNIIQRRELEPLMLKACRLVQHYEKASNCSALVLAPDWDTKNINFDNICRRCNNKECEKLHVETLKKTKKPGGSYIYLCSKGYVFWASPFYSGERYAGSLFSGGIKGTEKNSDKINSLAQLMLLCADQISKINLAHKKISLKYSDNKSFSPEKHQANQETKTDLYPLDMERMLIASLRRGDHTEAQKILEKLLNLIYQKIKNGLKSDQRADAFRLKALELAVLLSRAAANPQDIKDNTSLETIKHYIKKIEESNTFEDITEILKAITERMSGMIFSFHGVRHFSALRKAERYIWTHYTRKLSLREIAKASGLSAPYFSTVFKEEMGENLSNYLNRLRIEKAAAMLVTTNLPISEIATACGFEDQSWFSKIFKNNTGFTPGKYREFGIHAGCNDAANMT